MYSRSSVKASKYKQHYLSMFTKYSGTRLCAKRQTDHTQAAQRTACSCQNNYVGRNDWSDKIAFCQQSWIKLYCNSLQYASMSSSNLWTRLEHKQTNLKPTDINSPQGKGMEWSTLGVTRSKFKVTEGHIYVVLVCRCVTSCGKQFSHNLLIQDLSILLCSAYGVSFLEKHVQLLYTMMI